MQKFGGTCYFEFKSSGFFSLHPGFARVPLALCLSARFARRCSGLRPSQQLLFVDRFDPKACPYFLLLRIISLDFHDNTYMQQIRMVTRRPEVGGVSLAFIVTIT